MKKYILIADPSKLSRYVLEHYLSEKYNILQASSFTEAKIILNDILPALVIVSYELQDGLGFDLCKYLHEDDRLANIPVVMLSSNDDSSFRKKAFKLGVIDFISKSTVDENLVMYIDQLIEIIGKSDISGSTAFIISKESEILSSILNILESTGVKSIVFNNLDKFFSEINNKYPDVIICDLFLDEMNCFELAKKVKSNENFEYIPIIALAENVDNALVRNFIIHGISNFVDRNNYSFEKILLFLNNQIKTKKLYDELRYANKELYIKATTDSLTGLYNRRYFMDRFENSLYNLKRYGHICSVFMLDIDFFKKVNDTYGHDAGDIVLKEFSCSLSAFFRKSDIICRFGGEEFICLIHNIDRDGFITVAKNFLNIIRKLNINVGFDVINITASIGGVLCCDDYNTTDEIIKAVDELLYYSKNNGRNMATLKVADEIITLH